MFGFMAEKTVGSVCGFMMVTLVAVTMVLNGPLVAKAKARTRIVVLPFYSEEGRDVLCSAGVEHYRRAMRFINNQLDRHDFEVINPFARENNEREYDRVMERAREDSVLAVRELCEKYGVDVAYIVWLKVKVRHTPDGYYKASVILDGEGYDAAGHDLGAGVYETFKVTRRDRDEAIGLVEKWAGDQVGRTLTAWNGEHRPASATVVVEPAPAGATRNNGVLARNAAKYRNVLNVRLDGATDWQIAEVFGKILNTVTGMQEATRYGASIVPDNPQASYASWRARIDGTEPFRLQANVMTMIKQVIDAGGRLTLKGVPYRYSPEEIELLKGVRPGKANSRQLQFVVDRNQVIDKEYAQGAQRNRFE